MGTRFSNAMKSFFDCEDGAYSVVTQDEYKKSQVTFVGHEQKIAERFFKEKISNNHGNIDDIKAAGFNPEVLFRKFPTGEFIPLTVSYKKNRPNELRYYLRKGNFKPNPGEYWGLFVRNEDIWICHFSEWMRTEIESGRLKSNLRAGFLEPEEDNFQEVINSPPAAQITLTATKWKRDPSLSSQALSNMGYQCELYPKYPTFISKSSGLPFQEAHHLIPMKSQEKFPDISLDRIDNICILSPYAHRKIHHAPFDEIVSDLRRLMSSRIGLLESLSIIEDDVLSLYR